MVLPSTGKYYGLSAAELNRLRVEYNSRETLVHAEPGDVLFWVSSFLLDRELVSLVCTKRHFTAELDKVINERKDGWSKIVIQRRRSMRYWESRGDTGDDYSRCRSNIGRLHFAIDVDVKKIFCSFLSKEDLTYFVRVEAEKRWTYWC